MLKEELASIISLLLDMCNRTTAIYSDEGMSWVLPLHFHHGLPRGGEGVKCSVGKIDALRDPAIKRAEEKNHLYLSLPLSLSLSLARRPAAVRLGGVMAF